MRRSSSLFDEAEADRQVMLSLLKEIIKRLGDTTVSRLLQDQQGNLYVAHQFERVSEEDAQEMISNFNGEVAILQDFINSNQNASADPVSAPTDQPADQGAPADASQPPVDQPQPTADPVAAPPAPAEQPAPADPSQPPAPADPNAPAQPEQPAPADQNPVPEAAPAPVAEPAPLQ